MVKFKYEDVVHIEGTNIEGECIDVQPQITPFGISIQYVVHTIQKGKLLVPENKLRLKQ